MQKKVHWVAAIHTTKKLHGQFFYQIQEVAGEEKWLWLRDRSIKRET